MSHASGTAASPSAERLQRVGCRCRDPSYQPVLTTKQTPSVTHVVHPSPEGGGYRAIDVIDDSEHLQRAIGRHAVIASM